MIVGNKIKKEDYIISPSDLSYICPHCAYLKQNYNLYDKGISVGILQTLDPMEKKYFLGDTKKISSNIPKGEIIDPYNEVFFSKILLDNNKKSFRIKGKCDALVSFKDGSSGVIDYKTSKFKEQDGKDYKKQLTEKIKQYDPQLHAYSLLYSNLETDIDFLKQHSRATRPESIKKSINNKLEKINKISIKKTSLLGLVFVYPENMIVKNGITINFSHHYENIKLNMDKFEKFLTNYFDMLDQKKPPSIPKECRDMNNRKHCVARDFFYDEEKLEKLKKNN